jgi:DNA gyrase/topoisomerase IV subunit A
LITLEKIEEWIQEVEERPGSAAIILRYVAGRLRDLAARNEELLADNISLRSGRKVEEYESRIANLEYQLGLLKRQLGDEQVEVIHETASLFVFNQLGQVLRIELDKERLEVGSLARFNGDPSVEGVPPRMLVTGSQEELLFVFDSGRTAALPAGSIPAASSLELDWTSAFTQEPRGVEELAAILPIGRMSLSDASIQVSRRGHIKKIKSSYFQAHVGKQYIGTGVKLPADQTCCLTLASDDDILVLASQEGYLLSLAAARLPLTIEEAFRPAPGDHIITAFTVRQKPSIVGITQNGKVLLRDVDWLELAESFKGRGQALFSKARREAGVRLVGAAAVEPADWAFSLDRTGYLSLHTAADMMAKGSTGSGSDQAELLAFTVLG